MRYSYSGFLIIAALVLSAFWIADQLAILQARSTDRMMHDYYTKTQGASFWYEERRYDLPGAIGIVHHDVFNVPQKNNLILLGNSQVRLGIWPDAVVVPPGWNYNNFGMAADNQRSLKLMVNYLTQIAGHPPNHSDTVVVQFWWLTPKSPPDATSVYLKRTIELFNEFKVDDQMNVHRISNWPVRELSLMRYRLYLALATQVGWPVFEPDINLESASRALAAIESTGTWFQQKIMKRLGHAPAISNQETTTEPAVNAFKKELAKEMSGTTEHTTFPGPGTDELLALILDLSTRTNVVVVSSYEPSFHKEYRLENEYQQWVNSTLKPTLESRHIPFLDFKDAMHDDEFMDYGHLNLPGRIRYTKMFMEELSKVLPNAN